MSSACTLAQVRAALKLTDFDAETSQRRMAPRPRTLRRSPRRLGSPKQAAVMILLYPTETAELALVLVRRTVNPHDKHSGQISLPGGSQEPDETVIQTAVRETREEVGIADGLNVIGQLTSLYIPPSDFDVHPVVGYLATRPVWVPDVHEVAEIIECPVSWLLDDARKIEEEWNIQGRLVHVPWYNIRGHKVWGATAIILSEFEHRLKQVGV